MGMYNEVYKKCPECGGRGYMQIGQLVLGFGEFDLDDPDSVASALDHNEDLIRHLKERVLEEVFVCQECSHCFNPYRNSKRDVARSLAHELFDEDGD